MDITVKYSTVINVKTICDKINETQLYSFIVKFVLFSTTFFTNFSFLIIFLIISRWNISQPDGTFLKKYVLVSNSDFNLTSSAFIQVDVTRAVSSGEEEQM